MNPETHTCDCGYTWRHGHSGTHLCGPQYRKTIAELRAAAAPQVVADERAAQADGILATTIELARCIWRDNYKNEAPDWEPLTDLAGVLSQIDNMVCGMRRAAPVQAQEPLCPDCDGRGFNYWGEGTPGNGFDVAPEPPEIERCEVCDGSGKAPPDSDLIAPVQPVAVPDCELPALPALPDQFGQIDIYHDSGRVTCVDGYTADQMRGYAIDYGIKLGFSAPLAQTDSLVIQINSISEVTDPQETLNSISVAVEENISKVEVAFKIPEDLLAVDNTKNSERLVIEEKAQAIYNTWQSIPGFVVWTHGGNSHMQERARDMARAAIAAKAVS